MVTMQSMKSLKNKLLMQYTLERLLEFYQECNTDADRYYIKMKLLEYVESGEASLSTMINYMRLQEDKFEPFIQLLIQLDASTICKDSISSIFDKPYKVEVYAFNSGEL